MKLNALILAAATLSAAAAAQDTFENGANPSAWTFDTFVADTLETTGGNPGGWLRNDAMATIPSALCDPTVDSPFNGDYIQMDVTSITVDAITEQAGFNGPGARQFTIILRDTKGNTDVTDDDFAYSIGPIVPQVGQGWVSYTFGVPSSETGLPAAWTGASFSDWSSFNPGYDWTQLMQNVDSVEFWWADPTTIGIFQAWDVGIDNVEIHSADLGMGYCTAAVPNSTGAAGHIYASGSSTAAQNDITLNAESLPNNAFGFFLTSQVQGFVTNPGGSEGNLCLSGSIGRYVGPGQIQNTGSTGEISLPLDLTQMPTPTGFVSAQAGDTWKFQAWHRDSIAGAATSNFTDAVSITLL